MYNVLCKMCRHYAWGIEEFIAQKRVYTGEDGLFALA